MNDKKIESPALAPNVCDPRCCWHWGIGRRVCCKCGSVRVDRVHEQEQAEEAHR